ncbi:MAG: uroporphyrinogen-III synthase [Chloroflexi bacterium]|nr:uroporphyrinogen-III synthase [Chloroflexota bacterium]
MSSPMPLSGKHIVVTRARHQAPPLEALIRDQGGIPVAFPCIEIKLPTTADALDDHLRNLGDFDWLALTSSNAAWALAERARHIGIEREFSQIRIATLGPATSAELGRQLSRDADFTPTSFSAASLARQLPLAEGNRVLLPQSDLADRMAADILRSRGAAVIALVAYRTIAGHGGADLPSLIAQRRIDALSFASPSAVRFFRQRCPTEEALRMPSVCLGPTTAEAAGDHGFQQIITPVDINLRAMTSALSDYFAAREDAP